MLRAFHHQTAKEPLKNKHCEPLSVICEPKNVKMESASTAKNSCFTSEHLDICFEHLRGICKDFANRKECARGDECHFRHELLDDLPNETSECPICTSQIYVGELCVTKCCYHAVCITCCRKLQDDFNEFSCPYCRKMGENGSDESTSSCNSSGDNRNEGVQVLQSSSSETTDAIYHDQHMFKNIQQEFYHPFMADEEKQNSAATMDTTSCSNNTEMDLGVDRETGENCSDSPDIQQTDQATGICATEPLYDSTIIEDDLDITDWSDDDMADPTFNPEQSDEDKESNRHSHLFAGKILRHASDNCGVEIK